MLIVMLDASTLGDDIDFSVLNSFGEVKIYEKTAPYDVAERIKNADIVIVNKVKMNPEVLCSAEKLKLICITATGYDNIDVKYCSEKGIILTTSDLFTERKKEFNEKQRLFPDTDSIVHYPCRFGRSVRHSRYGTFGRV